MAKKTLWNVVRVAFQRYTAYIASLRLRLSERFDSVAFGRLRTWSAFGLRLSAFGLSANIRQGPGIAVFSIAGHCEPYINVRATLRVPRAVSSFTDTGTFLVSLGTFFQIGAHPLMDYFRSCGIIQANVPRSIVIFFWKCKNSRD